MNAEQEAKLRERVQKLLALSTSPNPHEAALAAGRAAELVARHQLDEATLRPASPDAGIELFSQQPLDASKRLRGWKIALASVLARVNDCRIVVSGPVSGKRHGVRDKMRKIWVVGRPLDAMRLAAMYPSMVRLVEQVTLQTLDGAGHRYREDFRRGVVQAMAQSMQAVRAAAWATTATPDASTALVPASSDARGQAVERWMQERLGLHMREGRGLRVILDAYQAGQAAGAELSLGQLEQLETSS